MTLENKVYKVDLRILDMSGYNVILEMDWLAVYRALIDCHCSRIIFYLLDGFEIYFIDENCVSLTFFSVRSVLPVCIEKGINKFPSLPS